MSHMKVGLLLTTGLRSLTIVPLNVIAAAVVVLEGGSTSASVTVEPRTQCLSLRRCLSPEQLSANFACRVLGSSPLPRRTLRGYLIRQVSVRSERLWEVRDTGSRRDPSVKLRAGQALLRASPLPARLRADPGAPLRSRRARGLGQAGLLGRPRRVGPRRSPRGLHLRGPCDSRGFPRGGHRGGRARQRSSGASPRVPSDLLWGLCT